MQKKCKIKPEKSGSGLTCIAGENMSSPAGAGITGGLALKRAVHHVMSFPVRVK